MSYLVFARKYRPQTFEDVVAQKHVTTTLANSIRNDRVGSAYLFCGPRGTGKTTTARILAKCINCNEGPTDKPCGECPTCIEITAGSSLDVLEIDAASNTGVDDIRSLRENVRYLPTSGSKRIYIIDEVHRLSGAAFDALLKTLEEPPPHVMFVFATTEPLKVPETVLSRTQRFDFKRVSAADIAAHIKTIAAKDKLRISDDAVNLIARKADGSVRDSLSLLDQAAAFAGDKISEEAVAEALGLVDRELLFEFVRATAAHESRASLKIVGQIFDAGVDATDFAAELMEHLRTLMIIVADKGSGALLDLNPEDLEKHAEQAESFSLGDVVRLLKMASDMNADLKSGINERLVLELTAVKMAEMEGTVKLEDILDQLGGQAPQPATTLFDGAEKKNDSASQLTRQRTTLVKPRGEYAGTPNIAVIRSGWEKFTSSLQGKNPMLSANLRMGQLAGMTDSEIRVIFPAAGGSNLDLMQRNDNQRVITEALRNHFGGNLSIRFSLAADEEIQTPAAAGDEKKVDVKSLIEKSPRLKALIERVDGEVIGIKEIDR
jgi:DNA polymerase-3 subunit gamma/tau